MTQTTVSNVILIPHNETTTLLHPSDQNVSNVSRDKNTQLRYVSKLLHSQVTDLPARQ